MPASHSFSGSHANNPNGQDLASLAHGSTAILLKQIRTARRLRTEFFDRDLFGEPGWDILLDLFQRQLNQHRTSVTKLATVAGVPATTVVRWLHAMERRGLIQKNPDHMDSRRVFVSLTEECIELLQAYFASLEAKTISLYSGR